MRIIKRISMSVLFSIITLLFGTTLVSASNNIVKSDISIVSENSIDNVVEFNTTDLIVINETVDIISNYESEKTQKEIEMYALDFMQNSQPEHDIEIFFFLSLIWFG